MKMTKSLKRTAKSSRAGTRGAMAAASGLKASLTKAMGSLRSESGAQVGKREIDRAINKSLIKETGGAIHAGEKKRAERLIKEMDKRAGA